MATAGNKNINAKLVDNILNAIAKLGFTEPTPIQAQGWPMALKGRDLIWLFLHLLRLQAMCHLLLLVMLK
ncbi:unnamed protein product [Brassica napus]|uniref:(rape) hypothetical protein n=1 Tax=Brassica napus TaxID=3708 RepID=A0A816N0Y1_BRANA|nr:unnamed protein product [Brassica napus]